MMDEDSFHHEDGGQGPGTPEGAGGEVRGVNGVATKKISLSLACWLPWLALSSVCGVVKIREALGLGLASTGHQPPATTHSVIIFLAFGVTTRPEIGQTVQHNTQLFPLYYCPLVPNVTLLILDTG